MYRLIEKNKKLFKTIIGFFVMSILFLLFIFYKLFLAESFIENKKIIISKGYSISQVLNVLKDEEIINSYLLPRFLMQYKQWYPKSGTYLFNGRETIYSILEKITNADYGEVYNKLIIPEGVTNNQLISIIEKTNSNINTQKLRELTEKKEGYLFPDTYLFLPNVSEFDIVKELEETFLKKITEVEKDKTIDKTRDEIVIMASLIEKEAGNNLEQKQIISGILWKRIRIGMPLQVDAPFLYERGKGSAQLSNHDLLNDSEYNTYIRKGLTPSPIGNPGYDSLYAAAHPIQSDYLFYLHGSDGQIHYAKKYSEHVTNKRKYLK